MRPDVLFVPIGGHYTLNKEEIVLLIKKIFPKVIIPMHYRSDSFGPSVIGTLSDFLDLMDNEISSKMKNSEGITRDKEGNIYIVSEPNLFFSIKKE
jgi:L-ascorbate metabolism protein UlaG (beta-lactamase superfamily)